MHCSFFLVMLNIKSHRSSRQAPRSFRNVRETFLANVDQLESLEVPFDHVHFQFAQAASTYVNHYGRRALCKTQIVDFDLLSQFNFRTLFDRLWRIRFGNLGGHNYSTLVSQFYANMKYNRLLNETTTYVKSCHIHLSLLVVASPLVFRLFKVPIFHLVGVILLTLYIL